VSTVTMSAITGHIRDLVAFMGIVPLYDWTAAAATYQRNLESLKAM
jgi:hypothetical protein